MSETSVKLEDSWRQALAGEFSAPYMASLKNFLVEEKSQGKVIFPRGSEYFRALDLTPLGALFGEAGFGPVSHVGVAMLEGLLFAGCVVCALLLAQRLRNAAS